MTVDPTPRFPFELPGTPPVSIVDPQAFVRVAKEILPQPKPVADDPIVPPERMAPFSHFWSALELYPFVAKPYVRWMYPTLKELYGWVTPMSAAIAAVLGKLSGPDSGPDSNVHMFRGMPVGTEWIYVEEKNRDVRHGYGWVVSPDGRLLEHGWLYGAEQTWCYFVENPAALRAGVVAFIILEGPLKAARNKL